LLQRKKRLKTLSANAESTLIRDRASAEASLEQRIHAIDQEADAQVKRVEEQFHRNLQEQLSDLDRLVRDHRSAAVKLLLAKLIAP